MTFLGLRPKQVRVSTTMLQRTSITDHAHLDPLRELQVELAMADTRILLVELQELALLEEQDRVEVVLLDLPKLLLERGERLPRRCRNVQRAGIVARLSRADLILVSDVNKEAEGIIRALLFLLLFSSALLGSGEEGTGALGAGLFLQLRSGGSLLRKWFVVVAIQFG